MHETLGSSPSTAYTRYNSTCLESQHLGHGGRRIRSLHLAWDTEVSQFQAGVAHTQVMRPGWAVKSDRDGRIVPKPKATQGLGSDAVVGLRQPLSMGNKFQDRARKLKLTRAAPRDLAAGLPRHKVQAQYKEPGITSTWKR